MRQISIETAQSKLLIALVLTQLFRRGKDIILGVIDLSTHDVETPAIVAQRIERALPFVRPERLVIATDCGMKYLPRASAFGKMQAMVEASAIWSRKNLLPAEASARKPFTG